MKSFSEIKKRGAAVTPLFCVKNEVPFRFQFVLAILIWLSIVPDISSQPPSTFHSQLTHTLEHTSDVQSVAFSRDGKLLVSATFSSEIFVWEVGSGRLISKLKVGRLPLESVIIDPISDNIICSGVDKAVCVIDTSGWETKGKLLGHSGAVKCLALDVDNGILASGSSDSTVILWDIRRGKRLKTLRGHKGGILSASFSTPNGYQISTAGTDNIIKIWRVSDGEQLRSLRGHSSWVQSVDYSTDGNYLVSGGLDSRIIIWNMRSRNIIRSILCPDAVSTVQFSPDGKYILSAHFDRKIRVWESESGFPVDSMDVHRSAINGLAMSEDGRWLASGGDDRTVRLWSLDGVLPALTSELNDSPIFLSDSLSVMQDTIPPQIIIYSPLSFLQNVKQTASRSITVTGRTIDNTGIPSLLINGQSVQIGVDGNFTANMRLESGLNSIPIEAYDFADNRSEITLSIERIADSLSQYSDSLISGIGKQGQGYALLFGVEQYYQLPRLVNPEFDVTTISDILKSDYGFRSEVVLNPTREKIFSTLRSYAEMNFNDFDQLLIVFSGHGKYDELTGMGYLAGVDARTDNPTYTSYLSHLMFRAVIEAIKCNQILVVIDACFSGAFDKLILSTGPDANQNNTVDTTSVHKYTITRKYITSGGVEFVPDGRAGFHSPFASAFIDALESYGGNDGVLTLQEIYNCLSKVRPEPRVGSFGRDEVGSGFDLIPK